MSITVDVNLWVTLKELGNKARINNLIIEDEKIKLTLEGYEGFYEIEKIIVKKINEGRE